MISNSLREAELDWADWFSTGDRALRFALDGIDPEPVRRAYIDAHLAGRQRGEIAVLDMRRRVEAGVPL